MDKKTDDTPTSPSAKKDIEQAIDELEGLTKERLSLKKPALKNGIPVLNDVVPLAVDKSKAPKATKKPFEKVTIPSIIFDKIAEKIQQKILQELDIVVDNLKGQIIKRVDQELSARFNPVSSKTASSSLRPPVLPK